MKTINVFFLTILAASTIGITVSCDSVSNPEPIEVINSNKTATIKGTVYANLNKTNDSSPLKVEEDYEKAPQGTPVNIMVKNSEYKPGEPGSKSYETTVDGDGNYSIEFPATEGQMNVNISFGDFKAEQTRASSKEERTFTLSGGSSKMVALSAGITKVRNAKYTVSSQLSGFIDPEKTTTLKGTAYANLDVTNDSPSAPQEEDYERAPSGTIVKVVVENSEYEPGERGSTSYKTTVDRVGEYSIEFPATEEKMNVKLIIDSFRADQIQPGPSTKEMTFKVISSPRFTVSADFTSFEDVFYTAY